MFDKQAELRELVNKIGPRTRAALGATAAAGLYAAIGIPAGRKILEHAEAKALPADNYSMPEPVKGSDLLDVIGRFKHEHPEIKEVPVFASGKIPRSTYVPERLLKMKHIGQAFDQEFGIKEPGVYLRDISAPAALHELAHVSMDKKIPGISLLTHATSALALPLLAWTILKKPVAERGFIERFAPAIAGALQIPLLAEEAGASIMAEKSLKREGKSGKGELLPNWLTYLIDAGAPVAVQAAATAMKRGL